MSEFKEYKVGEKIVYHTLPYSRLFYVKAELDDSIVVRECWDEAGAKCFSEFPPYSDIRPAKPSEIKSGFREGSKEFGICWDERSKAEEIAVDRRIDNDMGDDFPIENRISPNCQSRDV